MWTLWRAYTSKIIISSFLILLPMTVFTIALLVLIFGNRVDPNGCPYPNLCLKSNETVEGPNYYVDIPAGRLAFVSSLSSTISFTLVALCMALYGFVVAHQVLLASTSANYGESLPSLYQTTTLIRLLNAEVILLLDMAIRYLFLVADKRMTSQNKVSSKGNSTFRLCLAVFILSLSASVSIQAADTYFHVAMEGVNVTMRSSHPSLARLQYSRNVAPWCFDQETSAGTKTNKFFWGCALAFNERTVDAANYTVFNSIGSKMNNYTSSYTDAQRQSYAVLRPPDLDPRTDWLGHSYAVSSNCTPIPPTDCKLGEHYNDKRGNLIGFDCPGFSEGHRISGNITDRRHSYWFYDWHEYVAENTPFNNGWGATGWNKWVTINTTDDTRSNTTLVQGSSFHRNPWHWLAQVAVPMKYPDVPLGIRDSPVTWKLNDTTMASNITTKFVLSCSTTVWDVNASFIYDKVINLSASKSNGTVAAIVPGPSLFTYALLNHNSNLAHIEAMDGNISTPEPFVARYELAMSKAFAMWLAVHTVPAPVHFAQQRTTKIITKLPIAAFWLLVTANALFMLLGLSLTVLAARANSPEVHQVHTRLTTSGLAAQLFDWQHARKSSRNDQELSKENIVGSTRSGVVTVVGVRNTAAGGAEFVTHKLEEAILGDQDKMWRLMPRQTL